MRFLIILAALLLAACGKNSRTASQAAQSCGPKSVFSQWVDNGGVALDLSGLATGTQTYQLDVGNGDKCNVTTEASGDQCSGTITFLSATYIQIDPNHFTSACADLIGANDYYRDAGNLVYGRRGARPIEYH